MATPMMAQYFAVKEQYPDAIVFFRLGDFYEMFGEDAEKASRILDIVLTSREAGSMGRIPMCGVPYHSAESYIATLVAHGFKVAICEQLEDPKQAKGLVERGVIRVVTPGTVIEQAFLNERANNYLVAVTRGRSGYGLAVCDASTGDFQVTEFSGDTALEDLLTELARLTPAECLLGPASPPTRRWRRPSLATAARPRLTTSGRFSMRPHTGG
jgi:Mismatch repair ATPase (MutS family)